MTKRALLDEVVAFVEKYGLGVSGFKHSCSDVVGCLQISEFPDVYMTEWKGDQFVCSACGHIGLPRVWQMRFVDSKRFTATPVFFEKLNRCFADWNPETPKVFRHPMEALFFPRVYELVETPTLSVECGKCRASGEFLGAVHMLTISRNKSNPDAYSREGEKITSSEVRYGISPSQGWKIASSREQAVIDWIKCPRDNNRGFPGGGAIWQLISVLVGPHEPHHVDPVEFPMSYTRYGWRYWEVYRKKGEEVQQRPTPSDARLAELQQIGSKILEHMFG